MENSEQLGTEGGGEGYEEEGHVDRPWREAE